jgi:hypothetical protein
MGEVSHPVLRGLLYGAKNVLGVIFLIAGLAMLALPGQGILTIVIGLALLDFPGKFALERWLVTRKAVLNSINWMRRKRGRPPLILETSAPAPTDRTEPSSKSAS